MFLRCRDGRRRENRTSEAKAFIDPIVYGPANAVPDTKHESRGSGKFARPAGSAVRPKQDLGSSFMHAHRMNEFPRPHGHNVCGLADFGELPLV